MKNRTSKLFPVLRAMDADERRNAPEPAQPAAVTCHLCGAPVEADALKVQTGADGHLMWEPLCAAHLVAGTRRLRAAMQREGGAE